MTTFQTLDQYLSQDFSDDYWSDEGIIRAHTMIRDLSPNGWIELQKTWFNRGEDWQIRCAQILPFGDSSLAMDLLVTMIQKSDRSVRIVAFDSLRELDLKQLPTAQLLSIEDAVQRQLVDTDKIESIVLQSLLRSVKSAFFEVVSKPRNKSLSEKRGYDDAIQDEDKKTQTLF